MVFHCVVFISLPLVCMTKDGHPGMGQGDVVFPIFLVLATEASRFP